MSNKIERRFLASEIRAVKEEGKPTAIEGYAAIFNSLSENLGGFRERIKPGAFTRVLNSAPDVRCLVNHDPSMLLGRTASNTLHVEQDDRGLKFRCSLPDTTYARDLVELVNRGDLKEASFGFTVDEDEDLPPEEKEDGVYCIRQIKSYDKLYDVSCVTFPAYPATSISARELWPDGIPESVERRMHEVREAKTKRVDGEDLTAGDFLIVGDPEKTETWKLPWKFSSEEKTKSHLRNALARFDQLTDVGAEEKSKAHAKLVSLCKSHGIEVSGESSLTMTAEEAKRKTYLASVSLNL